MARTAGLVSVATMSSRVFGLVREFLFAHLFGAGFYSDAFVAAFRIPNLLRDLFAEGALSAAFVPTFTDYLKNRSRSEAFQLANRVMTTLLMLIGAIVLAGIAGARWIVQSIAPGFSEIPGKIELTTQLTQVMMPFLLLVSLAALAMGVLNTLDRFFLPAFASALFNLVAITGGLLIWATGQPVERAVFGWAVFTLLGGLVQWGIQLFPMWKERWRFRPDWDLRFRDPGQRRIAWLMAPATIGLAATQVNIFVNTNFASSEQGAASWLNYAFRLMQLPIGLFGVAIGTIATASLAKRAAERDLPGMRRTLQQSLRLVAFLSLPSTLGLVALATPVIRLLFERGKFHAGDTEATAAALLFYAIGLPCYSAVKVIAPAFYAMDRPRVPLIASVSAVAANLLFNVALHPVLGYRGLALGTAIAAIVNFGVLAVAFHRWWGGLTDRGLLLSVGKVLLAAGWCAGAAYGGWFLIERQLGHAGFVLRAVGALAPVAIGAAVFFLAAAALRIEELDDFRAALVRRKGGGGQSK